MPTEAMVFIGGIGLVWLAGLLFDALRAKQKMNWRQFYAAVAMVSFGFGWIVLEALGLKMFHR